MIDRRSLAVLAVAAGVVACVVAGTTGPRQTSLSTALMIASVPLAIASVLRPDTHIPLGVVAVTVWCWLRSTADVAGVRLPVVAAALLVFHATIALMATTPPSATPPPRTLRRWGVDTAAVAAATGIVWLLVIAVHGRGGNASAVSLSAAVLAVAAAAMWVRGRTLAGSATGTGIPLRQFRRRSSGAREIPREPGGHP